ncbi:MAG: DUF502 domain-containing protein [Lentimonas sp.]
MFRSIRNAFITGVFVILPLGVTTIVVNFLLEKLGKPASNFFFWYLDTEWRNVAAVELLLQLISVVVVLILITLLGYFSKFFIGKLMFVGIERLLDRVPLINMVYRTVKQIVDTFSQQKKAVFQEVVLIEYPRPNCYVLGFLTGKAKGETQMITDQNVLNIFVPTTPNPTSGFLLMLPETDVRKLEMSIADGMKLIISGGAVVADPRTGEAVRLENPSKAKGEAEG